MSHNMLGKCRADVRPWTKPDEYGEEQRCCDRDVDWLSISEKEGCPCCCEILCRPVEPVPAPKRKRVIRAPKKTSESKVRYRHT